MFDTICVIGGYIILCTGLFGTACVFFALLAWLYQRLLSHKHKCSPLPLHKVPVKDGSKVVYMNETGRR